MNLSTRQVYRLIEDLKDFGFPIAYSSKDQRYVYDQPVELKIEIEVNGTKIIKIK